MGENGEFLWTHSSRSMPFLCWRPQTIIQVLVLPHSLMLNNHIFCEIQDTASKVLSWFWKCKVNFSLKIRN